MDSIVLVGIYGLLTLVSAGSFVAAVLLHNFSALAVSIVTGAIFWIGLVLVLGVITI
ncbi:MAG: hypothetical protein WAN74_07495 [Thermoplasmata archaeon]